MSYGNVNVPGVSGAKVAAMLSAHNAAQDSHEDIRQRLTNPTQLINWYFVDPINQRGASGIISAPGYFIDRWILVSGSVEITSAGLVLTG